MLRMKDDRMEIKMDILEIINKVKNDPECIVYPPCGLPLLGKGVELPNDLKIFYENCGGISFFHSEKCSFFIVNPTEVVLANPIIVGDLCEEDISSKWYIIGKDIENNYITIDLSKERLGRCYDSFWDRHGVIGECPIISESFTDLVYRLLCNRGTSLYWLEKNFLYIGDAYDKRVEREIITRKVCRCRENL